MPTRTQWRNTLAAVAIAAGAFAAGFWFAPAGESRTPPTVAGFVWPPPPALTPFRLVDARGETFDQGRLEQHWTLVFFGYTHCPDICPITLKTLADVRQHLHGHGPFERKGQVLFVSVDGARDTPAVLRKYVDFFDEEFLAATAPADDLHQFSGQFGARIVRVSGEEESEYWFDHPASILLIGPDRRLTGVFAPPLDAADIASQVRAIVDWGESRS